MQKHLVDKVDSIIGKLMIVLTDNVDAAGKDDTERLALAMFVMINLFGVFTVTMTANADDYKNVEENAKDMQEGLKFWFKNAIKIIKKGNNKNDGH